VIQQLSLDIASVAGSCGKPADFGDQATLVPASTAPLVSRLRYCDGAQSIYQLSLATQQSYRATLTDLGSGGGRMDVSGQGPAAAYQATRPAGKLTVAPQGVAITAGGVVNAATFTQSPGVAPGGLMAIFGAGLSGPGGGTAVQINGETAALISQSPFQVNVQVPADLGPGTYSLSVQSPYGSAQQTVQAQANAPAIFVLSGGTAGLPAYGAVVNQDGSLNGPASPGQRGQVLVIYCTGLGAVDGATPANAISAVSGILNSVPMQAAFAGPTPGFVGLYQVNLPVPVATPPGIDLPLLLRQAGGDSNTVFVAIQ
jgi:uncharacterized protein (TIGR03437 family)